MKPLATSQRVLTWLCLLPPDNNISEWTKRSYMAFALAIIVGALVLLVSSIMYVVKFISIDFQDTSIAISAGFGAVAMVNSIIVAIYLRHKIPPMFEQLSRIYEKCM